ncbi:MAG: 30S ribosome-binding factor RbfA [Acidobacteriota bacterium]|nr:30S ribosome-binding factor RbfA [Acidobacteriota bacterium]
MSTHRRERIADLLQRILAEAVRDKIRDPRVGFVTLTEVRVSPDLRHARIYVSDLGESEQRAAAVVALNHAASFLRGEVARHARLKYVPRLEFVEDVALETGMRVERLLDDLRSPPRDDGDPGDGDA